MGNQYRRSNVPMGVPGPTRVNRSFSSRLSIGVLPSAPADRLGAHSLLHGRACARPASRGPRPSFDTRSARTVTIMRGHLTNGGAGTFTYCEPEALPRGPAGN